MPRHTGRGFDPGDPIHRLPRSQRYDDVEPDDRRYWSGADQPAGRVVDIDPLDGDGPIAPRPAGRAGFAPRAAEPSDRLGVPDADDIQHIGGRRRLRPEIAVLVVAAIFMVGALAKPWPSQSPAASALAAASRSPSSSAGLSASAGAEPTGEIAAAPSAVTYPDIPPSDYRWPFFGSAPSAAASGSPAAETVAPLPTWSTVDWSILTTADSHSGWGFAAAEMPGTGSNAAIPRIRWVDAGSPPVYASVPLVQGLNVYAVAVTWPRSIHVTAVKFVYLGPPQSPPYLPPAGFLPNGQVTPMPVLRVASPSLDPAASPTIPPWVDPAAGGPRSGEFLIPPSDSLHNPISSVLTSAWQDSPWPWPYGTYQITVTSDSGYRNIILDLLLN
jgi:hypothetical protein